ncbi:hypothetical protein [Candidatus Hakubella thermalkaliphila]|uniref:hypothetical protein n=1 Tax=Candidatus Hakubella thermalkaliphila TaxID=2754717 RepID=UPI00159428DA|nr:hypothetical protein [Candidatus Hakubella thermalkaliphila]
MKQRRYDELIDPAPAAPAPQSPEPRPPPPPTPSPPPDCIPQPPQGTGVFEKVRPPHLGLLGRTGNYLPPQRFIRDFR